ncbi:uncharacterized protein mfsd8l1 isoform 2-T3 [Pholidichthys leucotaenia]
MDNGREKKLTYVTIGLMFLLSGVEYAVILPTIWRYLQTLDAEPYFLGLVLSAFSLSGLLFGPLFGHWSDRTRTTKKIILFANVFEIIGNFMYFMGYSKWLLLSSRFVAGIGAGVGSSIFGYLTTSTAPGDRATVFAAFMACRQAGLVIGPAFNLFLRLCDFHLGPLAVNKYTAPGLFMCLLWILIQLVVVFAYTDLPPIEQRENKNGLIRNDRAPERVNEQELVEDEEESDEEEKPLMGSQELVGSYGSLVTSHSSRNHPTAASNSLPNHSSSPSSTEAQEKQQSFSIFWNFSIFQELLKEEVLVLLSFQFATFFNQTALETMVTPLTQKYFNFGELENSIMYFLGGVTVIAGFLFVRWLSRCVLERVILVIGLFICNVACIWFLIFLAKPIGDFSCQLTEFTIGVFLQLLGLPFVSVAQVSLFSKVTSERTQVSW